MSFNPRDEKSLERLRSGIKASREKQKPFIAAHKEILEQYSGGYFQQNQKLRSTVNFIELAESIFARHLAPRPPRLNILTDNPQIRAACLTFQEHINQRLQADLSIHRELQAMVKSSLFSIGIVRVGVQSAGSIDFDGFTIPKTTPYVLNVQPDDWVHDMSQNSIAAARYQGCRYTMPLEAARQNPDFDPTMREKLQPLGNSDGIREEVRINEDKQRHDCEMEDMTELWDIWIPGDRLLLTMSQDQRFLLRVQQLDGPDEGPFHTLFYNEVTGHPYPLPPAAMWLPFHKTANLVYRKLERQALRQKTVGLTVGEDTEDAEKIMKLPDGHVLGVKNPDAVGEKKFGGIDSQNFGFLMNLREMFSQFNGNLEILGGLGAQSPTATQDQILAANSSGRMQAMQDKVMDATSSIMRSYAYWLWTDPLQTYEATIVPAGYSLGALPVKLTPAQRAFDFFIMNVVVEPYSMQYRSPAERASKLMALTTSLFLPAAQLMAQSGLQLSFDELLDLISRYENFPELKTLITKGGQPLDAAGMQQESGGGGGGSPMNVPTKRQYERISSSASSTPQAQQKAQIAQLMAGGSKT